jgi:hypothetical protein
MIREIFRKLLMAIPIWFLPPPNIWTFSVFSIEKYAIVCTLSVRPSVCRATTFHGVDRSCSFMAQSIAYDPRA